MALLDDGDEFDPLFDYSGAHQPVIELNDSESDDEEIFVSKKLWSASFKPQKSASSQLKRKFNDQKGKSDPSEIKNDENWLPSPPKVARLSTDSMILLLRQKRAELLSITKQASETAVALTGIEATNLDEQFKSFESKQFDPQQESRKQKREKVVVMVQEKNGECRPFRIYMDDKFEKLYNAYAQAIGKNMTDFLFRFDGEQIPSSSTPKDLGLENEDIVEVHQKAPHQ